MTIAERIEVATTGSDGKPPVPSLPPAGGGSISKPLTDVEEGTMPSNDDRALFGVVAAEAATDRVNMWLGEQELCERIDDPAISSIEDTMVYLLHACDRFGLEAKQALSDAWRRYGQNLSIKPRARTVADGTQTTLNEARDVESTSVDRAGA